MALTDYDKKNLTKEQQAKVQAATDKWNAANAKGDTAGMQAAAAEAAAVRNSAGYKTDSSGNYTGSYSSSNKSSGSSSSSNKNSQWTQGNYSIGSDAGKKQAQSMGIGSSWIASDGSEWVKEKDGTITVYHNGTKTTGAYTPTDLGLLGQQQMEAGLSWRDLRDTSNARVTKAKKDPNLAQYAYDSTYWMMENYIKDKMKEEGIISAKEEAQDWLDDYEEKRPDDYKSKYDPKIQALLNEILNRDDFSYDVAKDPLYQQYANMYQREGDRAMRETMSEAAANAGGMNTYAITAAQQAQNYYGSQLNDRIPELYQLAYDMYLNDKESKVQDLGILQDMDESQYARYRDTMNDFYNDRNFAYGAYQDAVEQGNWQTQFDYNSMITDRDFQYSDMWNNMQWNAQEEQRGIENSRYEDQVALEKERYEKEAAKEEAWTLIGMGVVPTDDVLAKSGISWEDADWAAAIVRTEKGLGGVPGLQTRRVAPPTEASGEGTGTGETGEGERDVWDWTNGPLEGEKYDDEWAKNFLSWVGPAVETPTTTTSKSGGSGGGSGKTYSGGGGGKTYSGGGGGTNYTITNKHGYKDSGTLDWVQVGSMGRYTAAELERMVDKGEVKEVIKGNKITYEKVR